MRTFDTGATRDTDETKLDFDGFLSPLVIKRYAEYLNKHRVQSDGNVRDSGNWKKGIPQEVYMKSAWRHFMDVWTHTQGYPELVDESLEDAICAVIFNMSGLLYEIRKDAISQS